MAKFDTYYELDCPGCGKKTIADIEMIDNGSVPRIENICRVCGCKFITQSTFQVDAYEIK